MDAEIAYWAKEYPELSREEIEHVLLYLNTDEAP